MPHLQRKLTPEILDSLPQGHPDAEHNRRDLRLFNAFMGNFGWLRKELSKQAKSGQGVLELGSGDGGFALSTLKKLPEFANTPYSGLDLWSRPDAWPSQWNWLQEDIIDTAAYALHPTVIGNMILHQFEDATLAQIGKQLNKHAHVLIFNETARSRMSLTLLPLTRLLGTNYVSNHDAKVSVESGFTSDELPKLLGLDEKHWTWETHTTSLGAYRYVAVKSGF